MGCFRFLVIVACQDPFNDPSSLFCLALPRHGPLRESLVFTSTCDLTSLIQRAGTAIASSALMRLLRQLQGSQIGVLQSLQPFDRSHGAFGKS